MKRLFRRLVSEFAARPPSRIAVNHSRHLLLGTGNTAAVPVSPLRRSTASLARNSVDQIAPRRNHVSSAAAGRLKDTHRVWIASKHMERIATVDSIKANNARRSFSSRVSPPDHVSPLKPMPTDTGNHSIDDVPVSDPDSSTLSIPGTRTTNSGRMQAIVYTCNICETRSMKQFTHAAYTHGVVLVRCPGCQNLHLIADNVGYFADESYDSSTQKPRFNLETLAKMTGQSIQNVSTDQQVYELSLEDWVGGKERLEKELTKALEQEAVDESDASSTDLDLSTGSQPKHPQD
jgi:mitochondrial protein import protein ZIM17